MSTPTAANMFPTDFQETMVAVRDAKIFVRHGGDKSGPPVLLLHGHTQSSDMWAALSHRLAHEGAYVIALDLRGVARSTKPQSGYRKVSQAEDIYAVLESLDALTQPISVVAHDLGVMVAYPLVHKYEEHFKLAVFMEATVPGIGIWPHILQNIKLSWHFGFYGAHAERILKGREREYLDRFWDEFSANSASIGNEERQLYTDYYLQNGALHGALSHFSTFEQDSDDNINLARRKLDLPIYGIGGSESLADAIGAHVAEISNHGTGHIIDGAGHWLMEERTNETIATVLNAIDLRC